MLGVVVVVENGQGRYQQEVIVGQYYLIVDELESVGGVDVGLVFFDYLMVVLGGCILMILCMYVECKGWLLIWISVSLNYEKLEVEGSLCDWINWIIMLEGEFVFEQCLCLFDIVNKCFVYCVFSQLLLIVSQFVEQVLIL